MFLHEAGHVVTAYGVGVKVQRVGIRWRGLYTIFQPGTRLQNFLVILAGPLSNLYLALQFSGHHCEVFVAFNLLTGVANLLPLPNSDGYQAGKIVWQWLKPVASSQLPDAGSGRLINKLCWALVLVCVACAVEVVLTAAVGAR